MARAQPATKETLLTSAVRMGAAAGIAHPDQTSSGLATDTPLAPPVSSSEMLPPPRQAYAHDTQERAKWETTAAELEPVRMERQPSPYADLPSLYDLYVQAASPNRKTERFGLDVFRRGPSKSDILPMDLPVGPD